MPHASGDEPWDNWYYFIDDVVNPTQVGMNRVSSSSATPPENVPHASGDEPKFLASCTCAYA